MKRDTPLEEIAACLGDGQYVVLDTETTGLRSPELVSIAVIRASGETILEAMVRPGRSMEPGAAAITGITDLQLADSPEFPAIHDRVRSAIGGRKVAIYNAAYDLQVLENTCRRYRLTLPSFEPWCVMEWFARLYGEWNAARRTFTWQRLAVAADYFAVPAEAAHTALGDCRTTCRIIEAALQRARSAAQATMDPLF